MIKKQVRKLERRDKMDKIKQFVYKYQQLTKEEKKQIIKESSIEFLIAACSYGKMLGIDMAKEVKVLQNEIGREVLEDLVATEKDAKIELLKAEIENILENVELEKELYDYTEEEQKILDEYFEKTSDKVLENILEGIRDRLLVKENRPRRRINQFNVSSPAVVFPDLHHSTSELNYLEGLYRIKITDLNLEKLGIVDLKIVTSQAKIKSPFYQISYSNPNKMKKSKHFWGDYVLTTTCDLEKAKSLIKKR